MMKANKIEDIHRIYTEYEGVPCKIEADRTKQIVSVEYDWTGDDNERRCFDAYACVNGDPERFCMSEYANSDHDENWNHDVTVSFYGNLNDDWEILELVDNLLMSFFNTERALMVFSKLEEVGLVR